MELDIRYKQYDLQKQENSSQESVNNDTSKKNSTHKIKPYQEIIDYLEKHIAPLNYKEINNLMLTIQNNAKLTLNDGTQVILNKTTGLINLAIKYKDNSKLIASWTNISDEKEYFEALEKLK